jgi:hypothetical protein
MPNPLRRAQHCLDLAKSVAPLLRFAVPQPSTCPHTCAIVDGLRRRDVPRRERLGQPDCQTDFLGQVYGTRCGAQYTGRHVDVTMPANLGLPHSSPYFEVAGIFGPSVNWSRVRSRPACHVWPKKRVDEGIDC